jgi:hypothetical protein
MPVVRIKTPIIHEEKISKERKIDKLLAAFDIPESLPDVENDDDDDDENNEEEITEEEN